MDNKAQIIAALEEEFKHWEDFLNDISEDQITAPNRIADMSIKDIVAHLTVWQQINVARFEAAHQNREPEYPVWHPEFDPETGEELAKINAGIYESRRTQSWSEVHHEWRNRFLHFLELAESIPEKDLMQAGRYLWLGDYSLSAVLLGSYEHHDEHLQPLLDLFHRNQK